MADDAASPVVLGSVSSTSYMDQAHYVASFPAAGLVFVTGWNSDSVCVVDVSDPSTPTVKEGLVDSTYMDGALGIAWDPTAKLLFVTGSYSDSLAVISVAGTAAKYIAPTPFPSLYASYRNPSITCSGSNSIDASHDFNFEYPFSLSMKIVASMGSSAQGKG